MVMSFQRSMSRLSQICVYKYLGVSLSLAALASSYKEKKSKHENINKRQRAQRKSGTLGKEAQN